jgi:hypothetical protein
LASFVNAVLDDGRKTYAQVIISTDILNPIPNQLSS